VKENLTCEACERELIAYLDGALTPSVARVIERHVISCARCAATADDYRALASQLRAMPLLPAPEGLELRVVREMRGPRRILSAGWQRLGAGLAAASFAVTVGLLAYLPRLLGRANPLEHSNWALSGLDATIQSLTGFSKWLAAEVTFYEPVARQIWIAAQSLKSVPRVALVALRTPEAQVACALLITLGIALYMMLRPSRSHEGSVGHVCLSL
jgi:predicted anti-sigma-YlaC factor YlaD